MLSDFLVYALGAAFVFDQASECATGSAQKTVPLNGLRRFLIPLPPANEQARIVSAISRNLNAGHSVEKTMRLAIDSARRAEASILASAFSGRLVPQDPSEGTGHELLEKIKFQSAATADGPPKKSKPKKRVKA